MFAVSSTADGIAFAPSLSPFGACSERSRLARFLRIIGKCNISKWPSWPSLRTSKNPSGLYVEEYSVFGMCDAYLFDPLKLQLMDILPYQYHCVAQTYLPRYSGQQIRGGQCVQFLL